MQAGLGAGSIAEALGRDGGVRNRPDLAGKFVYFARGERTKLIKIGYSQDPSQRESDLQVGSGEAIKIILTVPGTYRDEHRFHVQFRACRERGEWFREEGRLLAFLRERDLHFIDEPEPVISVADKPRLELLKGVVKAWATTKEAKQALLDFGLKDSQIYLRGSGHESMKVCVGSFRTQPGWLVLAEELTAFGRTKKEVTAQAAILEEANIRIYDITHPQDGTYAALIHRAHALISGTRFEKDPKRAHRMARKGGEAKGVEMALRRHAIIREEIIKRIVRAPELTWARKIEILGPEFSQATLRRRYLKDE